MSSRTANYGETPGQEVGGEALSKVRWLPDNTPVSHVREAALALLDRYGWHTFVATGEDCPAEVVACNPLSDRPLFIAFHTSQPASVPGSSYTRLGQWVNATTGYYGFCCDLCPSNFWWLVSQVVPDGKRDTFRIAVLQTLIRERAKRERRRRRK